MKRLRIDASKGEVWMRLVAGRKYANKEITQFYFEPERTGSYEIICNSVKRIGIVVKSDYFEEEIESRNNKENFIVKWAATLRCKKKYTFFLSGINDDRIKYDVIINYIPEPQCTYFKYQWGLLNKENGLDINILPVWKYIRKSNIKIGVADSGIDYKHCNLRFLRKNDVINFTGTKSNKDCEPITQCEHGTHIAGIIAAQPKDGIGCMGIVESENIISLKVLGNLRNENVSNKASEAFIKAIEYAEKNNIKIINCSFCGKTFSEKEKNAMEKAKNIIFILAAGNNSLNLEQKPMFPACYNLKNSITVAAIDKTGELYATSNYGNFVDIVAPGENIVGPYAKDSYIKANGTSVATPFVTGVCALILEKYPNLTPYELKKVITQKTNVTTIESLNGKIKSKGLINAYKIFNSLEEIICDNLYHLN